MVESEAGLVDGEGWTPAFLVWRRTSGSFSGLFRKASTINLRACNLYLLSFFI